MCFNKPRVSIRPESVKSRQNRLDTRREWLKANPPNEKGVWFCYLNISPRCKVYLTGSTLVLEHVKPKGSHPELKHDIDNLKPACDPCNALKGSRSLESLAKEYPHLKPLLG